MQKIAKLYDASQAVLSTFDLDEALQRILVLLRDSFHLLHAAVLLRDERSEELYLRAQCGSVSQQPGVRLPAGQGIACAAAESRQLICVHSIAGDPRCVETVPGAKSEVAIPLLAQGRVLGVLDCLSAQEGAFCDDSIELLRLLSAHISIALQYARLQDVERHHAAQWQAVSLLARQSTAVTNLSELLRQFCALLLRTFPVDHAAVLLVDENRLVLRAHDGRMQVRMNQDADMPLTAGLCGRALAGRAPVISDDVEHESDYVAAVPAARSELCLPLISQGTPLGVLALSCIQPHAFQEFDLSGLEAVADVATIAIQNALHLERVRQLAYRDGLTGVFNRRYFEQRVLEELERSSRYDSALSILLVDVDGFKALNDELGHLPGDEALRQIASLLVQQVRRVDVVCRYGGDEFAILLPQTSGENALIAAEKLRKIITDWEFSDLPRQLSVSIGVACCPENGTTRDDLVKAADDALYRAKQSGRNCSAVASKGMARSAGAS
jgi:diguanylate cyclase (GGDEF)-like protein